MIERKLRGVLQSRLAQYPAVALLGPRQVGKTTLARAVCESRPGAKMLDMERPAERTLLTEPDLFLPTQRGHLLVLDEVQQVPQLFAALRPEIDADRRPGRFLLLGSASGELLRQSSESLAGRIAYLELTPVLPSELAHDLRTVQDLWLRGGFPISYLAEDNLQSLQWRQDFVLTFLQRDLPNMGVRVPSETLRRFWTMLAHLQGQLLNASQLGQALGGASHTTVLRYLDSLVDTLMVRRLEPHFVNIGKRLVKSPKVYVRDSGLLHALLGLGTVEALQGNAITGASWEGFVIEQVAAAMPSFAQLSFYRTAAGAELDLVVELPDRKIGIEIKFSSTPKPARGFWQALEDLRIDEAYVIAPVAQGYPLAPGVNVLPVWAVGDMFLP